MSSFKHSQILKYFKRNEGQKAAALKIACLQIKLRLVCKARKLLMTSCTLELNSSMLR